MRDFIEQCIGLFALLVMFTGSALALDMTTTFGAAHTVTPPPSIHRCEWVITKTTITANGVDSAVVSATDENHLALTTLSHVNVTGAGGQITAFNNVTLPKTLTSSSAGQWDFNATASNGAECGPFSIIAQ